MDSTEAANTIQLETGAKAAEQSHLEVVSKRILEKLEDYQAYDFSQLQSISLNIFFDLAQELPGVDNVYAVAVMIPKAIFNVDCAIYMVDGEQAVLKCRSAGGGGLSPTLVCPGLAKVVDDHLLLPVRGNRDLLSQLPFVPKDDIIGILDLYPVSSLSEHDKLFWGRYANRLGYQLHNRFISLRNVEHVQFIRNLVKDIGHNVIVPNMYFKLFYKRLEARINLIKALQLKLQRFMDECLKGDVGLLGDSNRLTSEVEYIHGAIQNQFKEIYSHYQNTSLFLETLLRSSHFEEGRYVLEKRKCNFKSQVIDPQMERYRARLVDRGIEIDTSMGGVPDKEIEMVLDVGLISQVFANLFSNAVKYTREVDDGFGNQRKFISYGWEMLKDHFGPNMDGIKLNVFTSGPALNEEERSHLFTEGFRGDNAQGEYGTGHGLSFIREVVQLHGGEVGYEATPQGNNFFFVLPFQPSDAQRADRS